MAIRTVTTKAGAVQGLTLPAGVVSFRAIPYAAPPVGDLRWRPPVPAQPWSDVRVAREFGPDPVQRPGPRHSRAARMSEDCLYLNVWAPAEHRASGWPVIVWSGGGAFATGGGAFAEEDPARLAARGAVVVTFNYRLGVFGFLAHAALTAESPVHASGNYGLMDCIAAVEWVRANIAAFGGDDRRITYLAESSGAAAGLLLLTTTRAGGLFDRMVLMSPGSVTPLLPLAAAEQSAAEIDLTAEQLRALPAERLLAMGRNLTAAPSNLSVARPLRPIVDGWLITTDDAFTTATDESVDIPPAIIGTNEDEGRFFTPRIKITTPEDYQRYLSSTFGDRAEEAAAKYPLTPGTDIGASVAAAYGDVSVNYPAERILHVFARRQPETFRYVYTYRAAGTTQPPTHSEQAATFLGSRTDPVGRDAEMTEIIGRYLLAFAECGTPDVPDLPRWPAFGATDESYLRLDLPPVPDHCWRADHMTFLANVLTPDPAG